MNALNPPSAERAVLALQRAVAISEGQTAPPIVVASQADLEVLPPNILRVALDRALLGGAADGALDSLLETGVLPAMLPEVSALVGFGDGEWKHKDVWRHTKLVVMQSPALTEVRWASLLHDIGKVRTRSITADGEVHFFGHAEVGARMFDRLNRRLPLFEHEESLRESIRFLIWHHLRAAQYDGSWTDSAVRRFAKEIGPHLENLLCLSAADITTKRPERRRQGLRQIDELRVRIEQVLAEDAKIPPLPKGLGTEISARFGIAPSPSLGALMRALADAVEAGELDRQQPADVYLDFLAQHRARFGIPET